MAQNNNGDKKLMAVVLHWGGRLVVGVLLLWAGWLSYSIIELGKGQVRLDEQMRTVRDDVKELLDLRFSRGMSDETRWTDLVRDVDIVDFDNYGSGLHGRLVGKAASERGPAGVVDRRP